MIPVKLKTLTVMSMTMSTMMSDDDRDEDNEDNDDSCGQEITIDLSYESHARSRQTRRHYSIKFSF